MTDARNTAFSVLFSIEKNSSYSNLLLSDASLKSGLSVTERRFAHRIVKTVLERKLTVDYNLSLYLKQPLKKLDPRVLTILRIGACQLLFMDKIPAPAAVDESVKLTKKRGCAFASGLVNAVLRKILSNGAVLPENDGSIKYLSVKYSFPEYTVERLINYYGRDSAERIMSSSLGKSNIYIRKNTLKNEDLSLEYENADFPENCLILKNGDSFTESDDFKKGLFHVQDLSSQLCCFVLSPKKGETVIDVCASPGGKSMTAAQMMENNGNIISCDIYEHKLKLINDTAERLGVKIIKTVMRDGADSSSSLPMADRILCDVPCSGLGVTGKKPEIKYKDEKEISALPDLQYAILENSCRFLKKGGKLVYSTCTLLPEENAFVCSRFLNNHPEFGAVHIDDEISGFRDGETLTVMPYDYDCDGFFIAAFERIV